MQIHYHATEVELKQQRFSLQLIPHLKEKARQILQLRADMAALNTDLSGWEAWLRTEGWSPTEDLNELLSHLEGVAASAWGKLQALHYTTTALIDSLKTGQGHQKRYRQAKAQLQAVESQLQHHYLDAHFSKLSPPFLTDAELRQIATELDIPPKAEPPKPYRPAAPQAPQVPQAHARQSLVSSKPLPEHVMVPSGQFMMGAIAKDALARDTEKPRHQVDISHVLLAMTYPVTQALYHQITGQNPSSFQDPLRPVENISWYEAIAFANALSQANGFQPVYTLHGTEVDWNIHGDGWRLPTEAEWEYLARGGEYHLFAGHDDIGLVAWYTENSEATAPVGQKKANGFGLYDMSGNVLEWCWDRWKREYRKTPDVDPVGPDRGSTRIVRGGGWNNSASLMRLSARNSLKPDIRFNGLGCRLVRSF